MKSNVTITTENVGNCFATVAHVLICGHVVHETDAVPLGMDRGARNAAETWAEKHVGIVRDGYWFDLTDRTFRELAE